MKLLEAGESERSGRKLLNNSLAKSLPGEGNGNLYSSILALRILLTESMKVESQTQLSD